MDQPVAEATETRLRLYMTMQDKWVQIGWVEEHEDSPTELVIVEDIDHKTALSSVIASALMNHPLEFRVVDYEIKEDDPVSVEVFNRLREKHPEVSMAPLPSTAPYNPLLIERNKKAFEEHMTAPFIKGVADAHMFHHNI